MAEEKNRNQYYNKYKKEHYDRIAFEVPKGERVKIAAYAQAHGYASVNAFVQTLVRREMEQNP